MVKVGNYDTFGDYIKSYRVQGIVLLRMGLTLDWIRLVIIVGGYILLRPILIRYGAKLQERQLEKEDAKVTNEVVKEGKKKDKAVLTDLQWGANARNRQQKRFER